MDELAIIVATLSVNNSDCRIQRPTITFDLCPLSAKSGHLSRGHDQHFINSGEDAVFYLQYFSSGGAY